MSNSSTSNSSGISAVSLLGIVFVALKLTGLIGWSWWWVTAPFWGVFAVVVVFSVVALFISFLAK